MIVTRLSLSLIGALLIGALPLPAASAANDAMPSAHAVGTAETVVLKDLDALSTGDAEALVAVFAPEFEMHGLPVDARALAGPRSDKLRNREQLRGYFKQAFSTQPLARHVTQKRLSTTISV